MEEKKEILNYEIKQLQAIRLSLYRSCTVCFKISFIIKVLKPKRILCHEHKLR